MRRFLSIFKMDLANLFKNPVLVGYNTVFAALLILVMGFLPPALRGLARRLPLLRDHHADLRDAQRRHDPSNGFMERDIKRPNLRIIFSPVGSFPLFLQIAFVLRI